MFKWIRITTDGFDQILEGKKIMKVLVDNLFCMSPDTLAKRMLTDVRRIKTPDWISTGYYDIF